MKSLKIAIVLAASVSLSCCAGIGAKLGLSQQDDENNYVMAANGFDLSITTGIAKGGLVGTMCTADNAAYKSLKSTRNPVDGVSSYGPADNAHAELQTDGKPQDAHCGLTAVPPPAPASTQ